jgi:hypothetical protein
MSKQKFQRGDLVQVADDLGEMMSHFTSGCRAIVMGSYDDQYGGGNTDSYTLHLEGRSQSSWYYEHQLTLIESNQLALLDQWKKDKTEQEKIERNLDWIFANGKDVMQRASGSTVGAIAECLGLTSGDLWGSKGEGYVYYIRSRQVMFLAMPFLENNDKVGWLNFCASFEVNTNE